MISQASATSASARPTRSPPVTAGGTALASASTRRTQRVTRPLGGRTSASPSGAALGPQSLQPAAAEARETRAGDRCPPGAVAGSRRPDPVGSRLPPCGRPKPEAAAVQEAASREQRRVARSSRWQLAVTGMREAQVGGRRLPGIAASSQLLIPAGLRLPSRRLAPPPRGGVSATANQRQQQHRHTLPIMVSP